MIRNTDRTCRGGIATSATMKIHIPQSDCLAQMQCRAGAFCWAMLLSAGLVTAWAQNPAAIGDAGQAQASAPQEAKWTAAQLESLVAPVALYPDPLLSQTLVATTYPLEIIQLQQWMQRNKALKDEALVEAVKKQPWDPSIQSLVAMPEVVERLAGNIQWTTDLGNAFLAQPQEMMTSVQRMRAKAIASKALVSNAQQTVKIITVEGKEVIVIEQANPQVICIPTYDPVVVYGQPAYPYPVYMYPSDPPRTGLVFGAGIVLGLALGGDWGYHCDWHRGDIDVDVDNVYVRVDKDFHRVHVDGKWHHHPKHRGGAPYGPGGIRGPGPHNGPGDLGRPTTLPADRPLDRVGAPAGRVGTSDRNIFGGGDFGGGAARASSSRGGNSLRSSLGGRGGSSRR